MKTNLTKLIELYTKYPPEIECGQNKIGEYGNNFRFSYAYSKLCENDYELLKQFVDFDIYSKSGVYMIDNYYIGSSKYGKSSKSDGVYNGIMNRCAGHLSEMFYYYWNTYFNELYDNEFDDVRYNYLKTNKMWQSFIENDKLTVTQLSDNPLDEVDLINEYLDKGFPLQNPQQIIERKLLPDVEIWCLKEHRNWHIDNIWFSNHSYVKLFETNRYDKVSLYHKYTNGDIDRQEFLEEIDKYNKYRRDWDKIKYRIYTEEFTEFDKNFRLSYEQISDNIISENII